MVTIITIIVCFLLRVTLVKSQDELNLTVIHVNDFHARFEETNDDGGSCKDDQCIGGFSRLYKKITDTLLLNPEALLLNGGDNFQGTLWYNLYKWNVTQFFLNKLPFDAIVLGNHEFDDGIDGVVPFITSLTAPVVTSNINDTLEPNIQGTYRKSVVVERNGKKIGIIGVILKSTDEISSPGKLEFFDESESVNKEAERLVNEENVFTNIVLSHSGYDIEQEIARKATATSKIGLVVGAHSHTFLYSGDPSPGPATPAGPYPTLVQRDSDGKTVPVVQASAYARYLGFITLTFDENGDFVSSTGQPIFLDNASPQDDDITELLKPWKEGVDAMGNAVLGKTLVTLDQSNCYTSECLLGNFVTDAMVYSYTNRADEASWTYASLAVYNAGGLRTTIHRGEITYNDMVTAQPFENSFDVGEIQGQYIKEMFEYSMTPYGYGRAYADVNLLHVSGFHIVANLSQPIGSRVESIQVRCNECMVPIYEDLDLDKTYRLIAPIFLSQQGGDGFVVISDNLKNLTTGPIDIDVFQDYLEHKSPVIQEIEDRIQLIGGESIYSKNLQS